MKRYVMELARNAAMLIGGLTAFGLALFAVCGAFLGFDRDAMIALCACLACGAATYVGTMLRAIPFCRMVKQQELNGLVLETDVRCVDKGLTATYLGEEWLIHAGHVALHHSRISSVKSLVRAQRTGRTTYICVTTSEGRQYRWTMSAHRIREVRSWLQACRSKLPSA